MATAAAVPIDAAVGTTPDLAASATRISSLDFIRGIAVIGILWANIVGYARPGIAYRWQAVLYDPDWADDLVWLFQYVFVDGKLRGLFALLFGAGIVLFLERAKARGKGAYWLQFRRLFWLAMFGLAHFFLLFHGDILFTYAALGMAAMWFVFLKPRWLILAGALLYCGDSIGGSLDLGQWVQEENRALAAPEGSDIRKEYMAEAEEMRADARANAELMSKGSFADIVEYRVREQWQDPFTSLPFMVFDSFALMLMGAGFFRLGLFAGQWDRRKLLMWGGIGIAVGTALHLAVGIWVIREGFPVAKNMFAMYGPAHVMRLPMDVGYLAVLVAMAPKWAPTRLGQRLSATGRMAFSNYLGTSLLMALIFQGWGLGLFNSFTRLQLLGFVALGAALMLLWSKPWLERFRFGPLEWLWRCLTYWRLFPMRRTQEA